MSLSEVINVYEWSILSFPARYRNGYYTLLGGVPIRLNEIWNTLVSGDVEAVALGCYLSSEESDWLPIAYGETYQESIDQLSRKLSSKQMSNQWRNAVDNFYDWYINCFDKRGIFIIESELKNENSPFYYSTYDKDGNLPTEDDENDSLELFIDPHGKTNDS